MNSNPRTRSDFAAIDDKATSSVPAPNFSLSSDMGPGYTFLCVGKLNNKLYAFSLDPQ
jgi:hypothetical protein